MSEFWCYQCPPRFRQPDFRLFALTHHICHRTDFKNLEEKLKSWSASPQEETTRALLWVNLRKKLTPIGLALILCDIITLRHLRSEYNKSMSVSQQPHAIEKQPWDRFLDCIGNPKQLRDNENLGCLMSESIKTVSERHFVG